MRKGFVFGKFLPFHKGHEAMIQFALKQCDFVSVLVCCSNTERIPDVVRMDWIRKSFDSNSHIEVLSLNYDEKELPNTSESSASVSAIWAQKFMEIFPYHEIVVTSEPYGDFVADFMGIRHIPFDMPRGLVPISATAIRKDLFKNWHFLPDSVKPHFAIKVVILGTESTGKSTLVQKLAKHYQATQVAEVGRKLVPDAKSFRFEVLALIAEEHARRINQAVLGESPLIIIDTDIHITQSYAQFAFGKQLQVDEDIYAANSADLHLYLNKDVPFVQDGTRLHEAERNALDLSHRKVLQQHDIKFIEVHGAWEARFHLAVQMIDKLLMQKRGGI